MPSLFRFLGSAPAVTWIGVPVVYSAAAWVISAVLAFREQGTLLGALLIARALVTVAAGVGIAAGERLAWAAALNWWGLLGLGLAVNMAAAAFSLVHRPLSATSWEPLYLGLPYPDTVRVMVLSSLGGAAGILLAIALWRGRTHFDVGPDRAYSTLLSGALAGLPCVLLDLLWMAAWWNTRATG